MKWIYLALAIILETVATTSLKSSEGYTKLLPTIVMFLGYVTSFYFLSLTLKTIPIAIAYAIWSAVGIVLIGIIGFFLFKQSLDLPALIGMGCIIVGVIIINVFSNSVSH